MNTWRLLITVLISLAVTIPRMPWIDVSCLEYRWMMHPPGPPRRGRRTAKRAIGDSRQTHRDRHQDPA